MIILNSWNNIVTWGFFNEKTENVNEEKPTLTNFQVNEFMSWDMCFEVNISKLSFWGHVRQWPLHWKFPLIYRHTHKHKIIEYIYIYIYIQPSFLKHKIIDVI
jgi:hypothetical protein